MTKKKDPKDLLKRGRHSEYNLEMCVEICKRVSNGENIKSVLDNNEGYPDFSTFCRWKEQNPELHNLYTRARQDKAEVVDSLIDDTMADLKAGKIDPASARIIIDTYKWKAGKYYPKMFGDKLDVTTDGEKINTPPKIEVVVHKP